MNISLCLTTYNRYDLLLESFQYALTLDYISEIVIVDDCSLPEYWDKIKLLPELNPKIKVFRQAANRGMSRNKADAISYAENEWCIIFDSDNVIDERYFVGMPMNLDTDIIYAPSFAWPQFDYRQWQGKTFFKSTAAQLIHDNNFNMLFNTCNYLVHRDTYLSVYKENPLMKASDTIWFNYLWLKAGNAFYIVPDCTYMHRTHSGSGFLQNVDYNMMQAEKIRKLISEL